MMRRSDPERLVRGILLAALIVTPTAAAGQVTRDAGLHPCRIDGIDEALRCATVVVPENRSDPGRRQLELRVVVVPALNPPPGSAPLFHLDGGPGIAATGGAAFYATVGRAFREHRDVVLIDQRGTGGSNPLHCPELEGYDGDPRSHLREMYPVEAVDACRRTLEQRADLTQYSTTAAAADLEAVRQAFGYERIDLLGISYGTRLALEYMRRYPQRVRSAALWGPTPASLTLPLHHARGAERAADLLLDACQADAVCRAAFPELRSEWSRVFSRLTRSPARAPYPGRSGAVVEVEIGRDVFAEAIRSMLYTPAGARHVPRIIHQAARGDFRPFLERVVPAQPYATGRIAEGLYLSITCTEDVPWIDAEDAERLTTGTFLGDYRVAQQRRACGRWPRGTVSAALREPVTTPVPTLVLSGYTDPVTPPEWGREVARHLPNSRHIVIRHMAHLPDGLSNPQCLNAMLNEFFSHASPRDVDDGCTATMTPLPFATEPPNGSADGI